MAAPAPGGGLLQQTLDDDDTSVHLVSINDVKFVLFGNSPSHRVKLGVRGFSACSVVILASDYGAIVTHVGPNEIGADSNDTQSFKRLAHSKMSELGRLYSQNKRCFGSDSHAYLVFATINGETVSPEQTAIFTDQLERLGMPLVTRRGYGTSPSSYINTGPAGTLLVERGLNARPIVYLEDGVVTPDPKLTPARLAPSTSSQPSSSRDLQKSRTPTQQRVDPYWAYREGFPEYSLIGESGQVLQRSQAIPENVWIRLIDKDGKLKQYAKFDGRE